MPRSKEFDSYVRDAGIKFRHAIDTGMLTREREHELIAQAQMPGRLIEGGDIPSAEQERQALEARNTLVQCNLLLVVNIAKKIAHRIGQPGMLEELISHGNLGLFKAVDHFDLNYRSKSAVNGIRFSTYATWWIKQMILYELKKDGLVRKPCGVHEQLAACAKAIRKFQNNHGREPTMDQLQQLTGLSEVQLKRAYATVSSLDDMPVVQQPQEQIWDSEDYAMMYQLLAKLSDRERNIVLLHNGVGVDKRYTLQELGVQFKITKERVRQLEASAKKKLKKWLKLAS